MQAVADEPTDRDVDLSFAQQPPIVDDAQQKTGQHQSDGHLRVDVRPAIVVAIELSNLLSEPGKVQHPVYLAQDVVVRDQLSKRACDEEFELIPLLPA